jgi:hypothetical protein
MYQLKDLVQLLLFLFLTPSDKSLRYAVLEMPLQYLLFDSCQRPSDRRYLSQDVDAVLAILDHPLDPPDLPFNPPKCDKIALMIRMLLHFSSLSSVSKAYTP